MVIVTTNLFGNYDPALLRRIQRHIKFEMPDESMRKAIFALHLPDGSPSRVKADLSELAAVSAGLSGGDILNVCLNAIHAGSADEDPAKWKITGKILRREIERALRTKAEHSGKHSAQTVGFHP